MGNTQAEKQSKFVETESLEWPEFLAQVDAEENILAVLDACDEPLIPPKVNELGDRAASLYHGDAAQNFSALAPYLAQVDQALASWIFQELAGRAWGFFAMASQPATLADVRRHFRRFLMVEGPGGDEFYFRFYDPRLMPNFLTSLTEDEVTEFFGPCRGFAVLSGPQVQIFRPRSVHVSPS